MYFFSTVCRYQFVPRPSNAFAFKLHTSSAHTSPTGQWSRQIDKETHKKLYCRFVNEINAPVSNVCPFTQHSKLILLFFSLGILLVLYISFTCVFIHCVCKPGSSSSTSIACILFVPLEPMRRFFILSFGSIRSFIPSGNPWSFQCPSHI